MYPVVQGRVPACVGVVLTWREINLTGHLSHLPNLFTNSTFGQIYREYTSLLTFPWSNQFHSHHPPSSTHQTTLSLETHPNWNSFLSVQTHPSKRCLPTNTPPTQHKKRKGSVHTQQKTPLMIYDTVSLTINVFIVFIQLFQIQQCTRGHPFQKITKKRNKSVQPKSDNIGALPYLH